MELGAPGDLGGRVNMEGAGRVEAVQGGGGHAAAGRKT